MPKHFFVLILTLFCLLTLTACFESDETILKREAEAQKSWPRWPEFEQQVPKPDWWHRIPIKYIDPMNFTNEEYQEYRKKNDGPDKYKREFKVLYGQMLKHQGDVYKISGLLGRGTVSEYKPLYEFYLNNFMHETWQSEYCGQCNDANAAIGIGSDLLYYHIKSKQFEKAQLLIDQLLALKYDRAIPMKRYYLIRAYRNLLVETGGRDYAMEFLTPYIVENIKIAEKAENESMIDRLLNL